MSSDNFDRDPNLHAGKQKHDVNSKTSMLAMYDLTLAMIRDKYERPRGPDNDFFYMIPNKAGGIEDDDDSEVIEDAADLTSKTYGDDTLADKVPLGKPVVEDDENSSETGEHASKTSQSSATSADNPALVRQFDKMNMLMEASARMIGDIIVHQRQTSEQVLQLLSYQSEVLKDILRTMQRYEGQKIAMMTNISQMLQKIYGKMEGLTTAQVTESLKAFTISLPDETAEASPASGGGEDPTSRIMSFAGDPNKSPLV